VFASRAAAGVVQAWHDRGSSFGVLKGYNSMRMGFVVRPLFAVLIACLAVQAPSKVAAQDSQFSAMAPSQMLQPSDLTPKELDYYNKLTDPEVAKNFIATRSFVRLCQKVVDKTMPAEQLPDKPLGFSVRYLLAGEATMINRAISDSIVAMCKSNPNGCLGSK
jgi:hypothetical protein